MLNLYYLLRFLISIWKRYQTISYLGKIALIGFIIISTLIVILSVRLRYLTEVFNYFRKDRSLYEIFIAYLFCSQIFNWFLKNITSSAAFEIRGWFISNYIWIVFSFLLIRIRVALNDFISKKKSQEKSTNDHKYRWVLNVGIKLIYSIIIGYWIFTQFISPLPHYYKYDPEYAYMLSSTTPFKDTFLYMGNYHPGSMMQLLGSFFTVILSPITIRQSGYPIYINVVRPEIFIYFSRFFLLVINVIALIILGKRSINITRFADIFAGLSIPLVYFASHRLALEFTTFWSPNSFNYAFGSILLLFLLICFNTEDVDPKKLKLISIGAGIIATFQVYMITWGLGVSISILVYYLISKRNIKEAGQQWILSILQFVKGYFIGTLVIFNHFESFLDWILNLIVHQGVYGKGPKGFFDLNQIWSNTQLISGNLPEVLIFSVSLILFTIFLLGFSWKKIRNQPGIWATAIGMIMQIGILFLLVLKHPRDPYLLSIAAILPILLSTIVLSLRSYPTISRYFYPIIFLATFISFSFNVINNVNNHLNRLEDKDIYQHEVQSFLNNYARSQGLHEDEVKKYWTYGTLSECYALYFGNDYAKNLFSEEISENCALRNEFSINVWSKKIMPDKLNTGLNTLDSNAVIIGNPENIYSLDLKDFHEHPSPVVDNLSFFVRNGINQ